MTPQEFSQKIKAKYPQYANVDDVVLAQRMIEKYPQYASQVKLGATPSLPDTAQQLDQPKAPLIDRVLNSGVSKGIQSFFPGKKVGQSIGTLGGLAYTKGKDILTGSDVSQSYDVNAPTPLQVTGDIVQGGAMVAGFSGVGATGSVLSKAATMGGLGALQFGGKSAAEGGGAKDIGKSALLGSAVGAGTSLAFSGGEALLNQFKQLPTRLINSATGQSKKELLAGKGLSKFMLENSKVGTADGLLKESALEMDRLNGIIGKNLKSVPITQAKITPSSILDDIVDDVNSNGGAITREEAKSIIDRLAPQAKGLLSKPELDLVTANKLRVSLDKTIGDKGFLLSELPFNKEVLRSFTNSLREAVKSNAPEGTRSAFSSLSSEIRLTNALASKVAQGSKNQIISFGDLIGGGLGGAVGGVPGAFAGAAARRAVQSTPVLTGGAVAINSINKALAPVLKGVEPALRTSILQAISSATASQQDPQGTQGLSPVSSPDITTLSPEVQRILKMRQ